KSTIDGLLNANGNNVFLINPNGVIITKNGTINANRFVASTTSLEARHFEEFKTQGANFSPVFKPSKAGNVVNMGNINANNVLLIGNKVLLQSSFNTKNKTFNQIKASNIHLVGNEIHADIATLKDINKLYITAKDKGSLYLNATGYYYNPSSFSNFDYESKAYNGINHNNTNFSNAKYVGIGSDIDWWHFAKGWNEDKAGFRDTASEYRLTNDIDFKGNKGQGVEGKDWQNYANYCIDGLGCTSMIVGYDAYNAFNKTFDGQGYILKNINIDASSLDNKPEYVGIFGEIKHATIKNINVDYMGGGIKVTNDDGSYAGGFAGWASGGTFSNISLSNIGDISGGSGFVDYAYDGTFSNISLNNIGDISGGSGFAGNANGGTFSNISLNNIGDISNSDSYAGGFAGIAGGTFSNISLNNIGNISSGRSAGGFAGEARGTYTNISLNHIGSISSNSNNDDGSAGGFAGDVDERGIFTDISLNHIGNISSSSKYNSYAGGFVGYVDKGGTFTNISLNHIRNISSSGNYSYAGGFVGWARYVKGKDITFTNISLNHIGNISSSSSKYSSYAGGFIGNASDGTFSNISLNNIGNISSSSSGGGGYSNSSYAGGFVGYAGRTFSNISLNNIGNISSSSGGRSSYAGGFASVINRQTFSNISLNHIGDISSSGGSEYGSYAGGFVGGVFDSATFKNIYIFFNPNMSISANGGNQNYAGKFFGYKNNYNPTFDNVHIYHHKDDLANANNDSDYWGNSNNKIQIHTYNDNDKNQAYNQFKQQDNTIARPIVQLPNITPPSNPSNPPDLTDTNVKLDENDLHQDIVNEIINDITNNHYELNIANLLNMLKDKTNYTNMNEEQKTNFIAKYFLKGDTTKALE
ncbi:filamentous hemagglutinin N-terminal domain-containing protein, partial [Campylobacter armoricus]